MATRRPARPTASLALLYARVSTAGMVERVVSKGQRLYDADKVALVRRVQTLFATGRSSHRSLADHLNESGLRTTSGEGRWWPKTIRKALVLPLPLEPEPNGF